MQKIKFTCPECAKNKLYAIRQETIIHNLDSIDYDLENLSEWAEEKEILEDSMVIGVICAFCSFEVAAGENTAETTEFFLRALEDETFDWIFLEDEGAN